MYIPLASWRRQDGGDVQFDRFDNSSGVLYLKMIGRNLRVDYFGAVRKICRWQSHG